MNKHFFAAFGTVLLTTTAHAAMPQLGGPMKHLLVTLQSDTIHVDFESGNPSEILELQLYEETYASPADALNGMHYSGQYGWLAGGFISLPPSRAIWIESLTQSKGIETNEQGSFDPIFTTDGSDAKWRWNGTMTHNWYSASEPGDYEATYMVYVGDLAGAADPLFGAGFVTMRWMIPQPPCVADINGDGVVDSADLAQLIGVFGSMDPASDLNNDGSVSSADLGLLIGEFGSLCGPE